MNPNRSVRTSSRNAARSTQLCRLAGCLSALALALPAALQAQDAEPQPAASSAVASSNAEGKGSITGRVLNVGTGMYLGKAIVQIEGTNIETLTGEYGDFELTDLPAGPVSLKISYTGLLTQSVTVTVEAGKTLNQEFKLGRAKLSVGKNDKDTVALEEFVVASERFKNAAEIAINEERYSPTIKNVVAANAFGDIPDGNIGEFVKYIPGVQIGTGYDSTGMNAADSNATSISVRGFSPDLTAITIDGVPLTNASPASLTRAIGLDMMTINNASRVEVIKVPTPDMPSNSPGGSINLVTRSSFEYAKPELNVKISLPINSEDIGDTFKKSPGPSNKSTYKTIPGADFSYVIPVSSRFGVSVSGGWSRTFNENHNAKTDYLYDTKDIGSSVSADLRPGGGPFVSTSGAGTSLTMKSVDGTELNLSNPLFYRFQITDTPNMVSRSSGALKLDWKPNNNHKIAFGYTLGTFDSIDAQRRLQFYNGSKAHYADWGSDFVRGYAFIAKGTVVNGTALAADFDPKATAAMEVTTRDRVAATHTAYLDYIFNKSGWKIDANINGSHSKGSYVDLENGHFSAVELNLGGGQIQFQDIDEGIPGRILMNKKDGSYLNYSKLSNWSTLSSTGLKGKSGDSHSTDQTFNAKINLTKELDFIPISWLKMTAKAGFYREQKTVKKWGLGTGYYITYRNGNPLFPSVPALTMSDYLDDGYNAGLGFNVPAQEWLNNYKLYEQWQANPESWGIDSEKNKYDNYLSWAGQQKQIKETSDQYYAQLSGTALKNRLSWVAGGRQEIATRKGYNTKNVGSWNFLHNEDGTIWRSTTYAKGVKLDSATSVLFANTAAGQDLRAQLTKENIWYPTAPVIKDTEAAAKLSRIPFNKIDGSVTGTPSFMGSVAYDILTDLTGRLSFSRTQGRPDFENGVLSVAGGSSYAITEEEDSTKSPKGSITVANPDLKPSINSSWDAQLAYYTKSGGKIAVSGYYKETKNPQETVNLFDSDPLFAAVLGAQNLDPADFADWKYVTKINTPGTGKTLGYELELSQNLGILGSFGRNFHVFGSFSHQYKKETNTTYLSAKPTSGNTASGGINFSTKKFSILTRAVWLEEKYISQTPYTQNGTSYVLGRFTPSQLNVDLNMRYNITRRYGLFFNARNVINASVDTVRYDKTGLVPQWAQRIESKRFGINMVVGVNASF